jgi:hypothetical protein
MPVPANTAKAGVNLGVGTLGATLDLQSLELDAQP